MKHLILTFFAIILFYSLFFDKKAAPIVVDEINYVHEDISKPNYPVFLPDTMLYLTSHGVNPLFTRQSLTSSSASFQF